MFCSNCGTQLPDDAKFCSSCGTGFVTSVREPKVEQEPQKIIVEHSAKKGQDMSSGFGRGFGETVGKKAGGCAWRLGILAGAIVLFLIVFAIMQGC